MSLAGPAAVFGQASRNINVVMSQEPPTLGYNLGNAYVITIVRAALGNIPPMTQRNDLNDWVPFVATETPSFENGLASLIGEGADQHLQVVFDMRNDVTWSDGTRLTAADFVFAWELVMHPDYPVPSRTIESKLSSVVADGDFRVIVRFMSENEARDAAANGRLIGGVHVPPRVFASFATQQGPVLDPSYYKSYAGAYAFPRHALQPIIDQVGVAALPQHPINRAPLGIGPFKVTEWVAGQFIATAAVPTFFQGAPRSPGIVFKIVSDTNAVKAHLATGEADVVTEDALNEFDAPDLDRLERQRLIRGHFTPSATWEHVDFNLDNTHLADARVRKAIAHAINRERIVQTVMNGKTQVIHSFAPTWRWDYNPEVTKYSYDPAKARQLLQEAGYTRGSDGILQKGGQKLSLKWQTTVGNQARLLSSQVAQQDLKEVGIDVQLQYLPASELFAAGDNPGPLWGRTFDLGHYAWVAGDDPSGIRNLYHSEGVPKKENSYVGQNFPGVSHPRLDELLHNSENSIDQAQRQAWLAEAQAIWSDLAVVLPLFARANTTAIKRSLQNFRPTPTNTPPTWNAQDWWLAE